MHEYADHSQDLSKLYSAWEKHYDQLGLATTKARAFSIKKTQLRRVPPGYKLEQLVRTHGY